MLDLSCIHVPVEFSNGSRAALALARTIAGEQARIVATHVIPPTLRYVRDTLFPYAALGEDEIAIAAELQDNAAVALHRFLELDDFKVGDQALEEEGEAPHELEVMVATQDGMVPQMVLGRFAELRAGLMVAGLNGKGDSTPGLSGAVSTRLVAASTRPVLLARGVDRGRAVKRVAVALDLSSGGSAVYQAALDAALHLSASLDVVTVVPDPLAHDIAGVLSHALDVDGEVLKKKGQREAGKRMARFRSAVEVAFPHEAAYEGLTIEDHVRYGDTEAELLAFAADRDIDLLVVGRKGDDKARLPGSIGRTTLALLGCAPCCVMVVP